MRILVIGNGFIAGTIIQRLESEGHELLVFSRSAKSDVSYKQIVGDILNYADFIQTLIWKPQVVIHTAWITTHDKYSNDSSNFTFADFTIRLATHVASSGVEHFIVLGSCAEYGSQTMASTAGVTNLNPESLYAEQKVRAFESSEKILIDSSTRFSWVRIFQPYGPGQDKKRLIPHLIHSIKSRQLIDLTDTTTILDWITTRDIALAISWIISNSAPVELDLGTSIGYTNLDLLKLLEGMLGNSNQWERLAEQVSAGNQVSVVGKDSPLLNLGWQPYDSLDRGLEWVLRQ